MLQLALSDTVQEFVCTARENGDYPYYLLVVDMQGKQLAAVLTDVENNCRYDKFSINPVDLGVTVAGMFNYQIWGQNSSSNTDPANSQKLVEYGMVNITNGSELPAEPTYTATQTENVFIFNGE